MSQINGKNVLVLGGAGFIGSHLVEKLLESQADRIIVGDSFFLGNTSNLRFGSEIDTERLEVVRLDATDFPALSSLVQSRKIDWVFNLAVIPLPTSIEFPSWTVGANIQITTNCCELVRTALSSRLIHISSSEVYGTASYVPMDEKHPYNPSTPYAASKVAGDQIVESYRKTFGIDSRIIRPFNNYGPKQNSQSYAGIIPIVIRNAMRKEPINIFGDGQQTRDYVFVRDTARTILSLSEASEGWEGAVNVATGVEVSVNNLVSDILTLMNKQNTPVIHIDPRPGDVRRHAGETSLLEGLAGFKPLQMTEGYLLETIEWYERNEVND